MKNLLIASVILATCVANSEPVKTPIDPLSVNMPGFLPVTIKPGTNVVANLPFTAELLPPVKELSEARPGDMLTWKGETHTFDGKVWSGDDKALVPIHKSFTVIRTANVTNTWMIAGAIDLNKAPKK